MTTTTMRRGWLITALAAAVAVLLGSMVAVAAWGGVLDQGAAGTSAESDSGLAQLWHGHRDGRGMMGENWGSETQQDRRVDGRGFMGRGDGN